MKTPLDVHVHDSINQLQRETWDALAHDASPFFEHGFLSAMEDSLCVAESTGWAPRYLVAYEGGSPRGALVMFRKLNSHGEFIFDFAWADASHRAGLRYYPKHIVASPFSPVGGPRFLILPDVDPAPLRAALITAAMRLSRAEGGSGLHFLFVTPDEATALEAHGFASRHTLQFQWRNRGYRSFDHFLESFDSKARNQIRRERRRVSEVGINVTVHEALATRDTSAQDLHRLYVSTVDKFAYGQRYLNERFFELLGERCRERLVLVLARRGDELIGGTINLAKNGALYGRYWGCFEEVPNLHFEVASYAGIEACIERGFERFEAGAGGGEHKFGRGFLPIRVYSAHLLAHPGLHAAVSHFLEAERHQTDEALMATEGLVLKR
ncbi:MAG: GNAT family N-acetyltransferase [Myxococcales bacterium]|nr:GNAT family N-acetyltransferase [Myxococcales bacterium]